MVFQEYALFPHLSVLENVQFGLKRRDREAKARAEAVLELVGLRGMGERMPHELSGGQQQRVALARALAPEPDLILLDEPFSNLDAALRVRVRAEVRAILKEAGATAVFVTHDQEEALSLVDRVAVMLEGRVQQIAAPHELYFQPATRAVADFVGDSNFLPGRARGRVVECELGELPTQTPASGPVEVLLRPESIEARPAGPDANFRVVDVTFFGHDQLVRIRKLDTGLVFDARLWPSYQFFPGQPVEIRVAGPVMVYGRDGDEPHSASGA